MDRTANELLIGVDDMAGVGWAERQGVSRDADRLAGQRPRRSDGICKRRRTRQLLAGNRNCVCGAALYECGRRLRYGKGLGAGTCPQEPGRASFMKNAIETTVRILRRSTETLTQSKDEEYAYWQSRPPIERLAAMQELSFSFFQE